MNGMTRRQFLSSTLKVGAAGVLGTIGGGALLSACGSAAPDLDPFPGGKFLGDIPFEGEGSVQLNVSTGEGLSGRRFLDHSTLTPETLVTSNENFYIRTLYPDQLKRNNPWRIAVNGLVQKPVDLSLDNLLPKATSMGIHLMECAGNDRFSRFGLLSAASWTGIPIFEALEKINILPQAALVRISGFDEHSRPAHDSKPGASWIFTKEQLEKSGAFLAIEMNDVPLSKDHGAPIRLVVPGWYGCTCIKWVNEITLVADTESSTSQMREFASRTHQSGVPRLARDFIAAVIDQAAMPVRVEKWSLDSKVIYRVVGILWGGVNAARSLAIRFNNHTNYVDVDAYEHQTNGTWSLWTHIWKPDRAGLYRIQLKIDNQSAPTRRLDAGYYVRTVKVG